MADPTSTHGLLSWDQVNTQDLEARLNAIASPNESHADDETEHDSVSPMDQFLADPELKILSSRSVRQNETNESENDIETIVEYRRVEMEVNQTRAVLHLSFQPDMQTAPAVEASIIDAQGRTRVTHSNHFGTRVEITLFRPLSEKSTVCVEIICNASTNINS